MAPTVSEDELLDVAEAAAGAAAAVLREAFAAVPDPGDPGGAADGVRSKSTPTDLVSDADVTAEGAIREVLRERRPGDAVLGEEGGETAGEEEGGHAGRPDAEPIRWVVDPLDGTVNFLFGIPVFAVSVACEDRDGTIAGVVLDPLHGTRFTATRSGPSCADGSEIRGSARHELGEAMIATGFGYDSAVRARQAEVLTAVLPKVRDIRRAGAAALDLSWTACGRYDAYYERGVKAWDIAAGALIARRAGLQVRELPATEHDPAGIVVAPPALIDELHALVAP